MPQLMPDKLNHYDPERDEGTTMTQPEAAPQPLVHSTESDSSAVQRAAGGGPRMTFDDDYCQFRLATGTMRVTCRKLGVDWPPPEFIEVTGGPFSTPRFRRLRYSSITDEERQGLTHVCRGAEYVHDGADGPPETQRS